MCAFHHFNIATSIYPFVLKEWMDTQCSFVPASFSTVRIANTRRNQIDYDYEIWHTHMAYIFVGSYTKFEVDGSVRYRDIAINVKWGKKFPPPPPAARALIVLEIYGSYLSIMGCY